MMRAPALRVVLDRSGEFDGKKLRVARIFDVGVSLSGDLDRDRAALADALRAAQAHVAAGHCDGYFDVSGEAC